MTKELLYNDYSAIWLSDNYVEHINCDISDICGNSHSDRHSAIYHSVHCNIDCIHYNLVPDIYAVEHLIILIRYRFLRTILPRHDYLNGFNVLFYNLQVMRFGAGKKSLSHNVIAQSTSSYKNPLFRGGGYKHNKSLKGVQLSDYIVAPTYKEADGNLAYKFLCYVDKHGLDAILKNNPESLATQIPLDLLADATSLPEIMSISKYHGIKLIKRQKKEMVNMKLKGHWCAECS